MTKIDKKTVLQDDLFLFLTSGGYLILVSKGYLLRNICGH